MTAGREAITDNKEWGTPKKYVDAVKKVFGGEIDLDPCSNKFSIVKAKTEYVLPKNDGLEDTWDFKRIYVNPPFGNDKQRGTRIANWLKRCAEANEIHESEVIALVPIAANTGHWKNSVWGKARMICFLYDTRLKFLVAGKDGGKGAPMACAMVYWGEKFASVFKEVFLNYGAVVDISNLHDLDGIGGLQKMAPKKGKF